MELLAPSGNMEAVVAAVQAGADAIYLGGKAFGARHYASNFSMDELKTAVEYCHLRDVSVYVTVNTLLHDDEIDDLENYLRELEQIWVDGIIVQDFAVVKAAKKVAPRLELHASTQMTIHNLETALMFEKLGFTRIVLARELTLQEIEKICQGTCLEVEIFVHGALCVSYSGQCLMSSLIGGRSGNRGKCAQPCRLPYQLLKENELISTFDGDHLLSPKDLNFLEYLPVFEKIGVKSLKIEGRMKSPEYVATVVHCYKEALKDSKNQIKSMGELEKVFHRGYSSGYLERTTGKKMMATQRPNNIGEKIGKIVHKNGKSVIEYMIRPSVGDKIEIHYYGSGKTELLDLLTAEMAQNYFAVSSTIPNDSEVYRVLDKEHITWASSFYKEKNMDRVTLPIRMMLDGEIGSVLRMKIEDRKGNCIEVSGEHLIEKPLKKELDFDSIKKQMEKLGGTPFSLDQLEIHLNEPFFLPVSELNAIRRRGIEELTKKILQKRLVSVSRPETERKNLIVSRAKIEALDTYVLVKTMDQAQSAILGGAHSLGIEGDFKNHLRSAIEIATFAHHKKLQAILLFPRIVPEEEIDLYKEIVEDQLLSKFDGVELGNFALLEKIRFLYPDLQILGSFSLNILNSDAAEFYLNGYFDEVALSPELTIKEIKKIAKRWGSSLQVQVYGHQELMVSKFCAIGAYLGNLDQGRCSSPCKVGKSFYLKDRKKEIFPLVTDEHCRMHILNGKKLSMLPYMHMIRDLKIKRVKLDCRMIDDHSYLKKIVGAFVDSIKNEKQVSKEEEKNLLGSEITRGHYFRGVE